MPLREVTVECYAGARADETPRRVSFDGREHLVTRLLDESFEERFERNQQSRRRYRVLTDAGLVLELVHTNDGAWYIVL